MSALLLSYYFSASATSKSDKIASAICHFLSVGGWLHL